LIGGDPKDKCLNLTQDRNLKMPIDWAFPKRLTYLLIKTSYF
jgi:hypothetical protein